MSGPGPSGGGGRELGGNRGSGSAPVPGGASAPDLGPLWALPVRLRGMFPSLGARVRAADGQVVATAALSELLESLGLAVSDFVAFVTFGAAMPHLANLRPLSDLETVPYLGALAERLRLRCAGFCSVLDGAALHHDPAALAQRLFLAHAIAVGLVLPDVRGAVASGLDALPATCWPKYMTMPFRRAINCFLEDLRLDLKHPLVSCVTVPLASVLTLKKRVRSRSFAQEAVSVANRCRDAEKATDPAAPRIADADTGRKVTLVAPAPSRRREAVPAFNDAHDAFLGEHERALLAALRGSAPDVPCGNPFSAMVRALALRAATKAARVVFPANVERCPVAAPERDLYSRVLAHNVLCSSFSLPVISAHVARAVLERPPGAGPRAVLCEGCGHCLNFGRGKFRRVDFKPTSVFYCRDRREKQLSVCATTGRVYCSYCGCADVRVVPLWDATGGRPIVRAVIANNAACAVNDALCELDVVVPCLYSSVCDAGVLKRVLVGQLMYLTSRPENLACARCLQ
ncbi:protein UL49 [Eptesicus fuscus gammaherpesvirus]|uniref:Protein UL49 n=1 Tax=vespertilionid gammaherpesvirus 3 TaxID=2846598 RepID=A0A2D0ZP09_9GAMA|nr:protein UL49 [Eptesicus fuscus gammaherpesvirus]ATA58297.1 protein UL49 [Eptesicus fuscus gammaherpesvirus]WAH70903.1 UL49 [Eptesicus fuscus gammaherpesvirus]